MSQTCVAHITYLLPYTDIVTGSWEQKHLGTTQLCFTNLKHPISNDSMQKPASTKNGKYVPCYNFNCGTRYSVMINRSKGEMPVRVTYNNSRDMYPGSYKQNNV